MLCVDTVEVESEDGSMVEPLSASFIVSPGLWLLILCIFKSLIETKHHIVIISNHGNGMQISPHLL